MRRAAATALLGATLGASGLLFALPSLVVPGAALLLLAPAAAAWVRLAAGRARLEMSAGPAAVQEGDGVLLTATARVPRWAPPAELSAPSLRREAEVARGAAELHAQAQAGRRGRRELGPALLAIGDPLGLAERTAGEASAELLVLPRIHPVRLGRRAGREGADVPVGRGAGPELELDSLRPQRAGAPASRIHWPTVARVGEVMERRLIPEADTRPLVALDPSAPASEAALDRAVRATASLCRALAAAGGCRLLLPGDRRAAPVGPDLRGWAEVHERLALLEPSDLPLRVPRRIGASALFWVLAAARAAPRGLARAGGADRYLVTPGDAPAAGAAFTVAGCAAVRVGRSRARAA